MGFFSRKKKVVKEIDGPMWGHLVNVHKIDVDTLSKSLRFVEREGVDQEQKPRTFLRVFRWTEAQQRGIAVEGWETLDQHPDLILFEGYQGRDDEIHLELKNA